MARLGTIILRSAVALAVLGAAAPPLRGQPCHPYWANGFPIQLRSTPIFAAFDDGSGPALYAFLTADHRVFRWRDGESDWTPLETGLPNTYDGSFLTLDDGSGPHLCIQGTDVSTGTQRYWVARWNGASWEFPWPNILSLTPPRAGPAASGDVGDGPTIYGEVLTGNRVYPARWAVDHWETFGTPLNGDANEFEILDDGGGPGLFVTGGFTMIGGVPAPGHTARYRNGQWVGIGDGQTIASPSAVLNDGSGPVLYTESFHSFATQQSYRGLAKFDGHEWVLVGQMDPPGAIYALGPPIAFDDGISPAVYVWGSFSNMGGVPARGIARYDGHAWSTLGDGVTGNIGGVAVLPGPRGPSLILGGDFSTAGGGSVSGTARWVGCPNCYANCDLSTRAPALNVNDFICFMTRFAQHAPEANCTNDATIDVSDFICFMGRFAAGCP